jgi:hypothetical protein
LGSQEGSLGISSEVEGTEKGNCPKLEGAKVIVKVNESKAISINLDAFLRKEKKIFVFITNFINFEQKWYCTVFPKG